MKQASNVLVNKTAAINDSELYNQQCTCWPIIKRDEKQNLARVCGKISLKTAFPRSRNINKWFSVKPLFEC